MAKRYSLLGLALIVAVTGIMLVLSFGQPANAQRIVPGAPQPQPVGPFTAPRVELPLTARTTTASAARPVRPVATKLSIGMIDLAAPGVISSEHALPVPDSAGTWGTGNAYMSFGSPVAPVGTAAATAALVCGFLPLEPIGYAVNNGAYTMYDTDANGCHVAFFSTGGAGYYTVKAQGMFSGRVAGALLVVSSSAPVGPNLAVAPHAVVPGGTQPVYLAGTRYGSGQIVTVSHDVSDVLTLTTAVNGSFVTTLAVGAGPDGSAVYSAYRVGAQGSRSGRSVEERADAGPITPRGDYNDTRAFFPRGVLSSTIAGRTWGGGDGFDPGEQVSLTLVGGSFLASVTADVNGTALFDIGYSAGAGIYHLRLDGRAGSHPAYMSLFLDIYGSNRPSGMASPTRMTTGSTVAFVFNGLLPNQSGQILVDNVFQGNYSTDPNGLGSINLSVPITGEVVHSLRYAGTGGPAQVAVAPALFGNSGVFSGTVRDAINGRPIKARIQLGPNASSGFILSNPNDDGRFALTYEAGTYTASVSSSGCYDPITVPSVVIPAGGIVTATIYLVRSISPSGYGCYENAGREYQPASRLVVTTFVDQNINVNFPFGITYFGQRLYNGTINANGFMTLGTPNTTADPENSCIPNPVTPNGTVAVLWDDLRDSYDTYPTSGIYTDVVGIAPYRTFIVEWRDAVRTGDTVTNTVQIQIDEYNSEIYLIYPTARYGRSDGREATVGIENLVGSTGINFFCNTGSGTTQELTNYIWAGNSVRFYPPPVATCSFPFATISDQSTFTDVLRIANGGAMGDVNIYISTTHSYVGDLSFTLRHADTGTTATIIDRPGYPATPNGCSGDNIDATLNDESTRPVESECSNGDPTIYGSVAPNNPLSVFDSETLAGQWELSVSDAAAGNQGRLITWCVQGVVGTQTPTRTPTNTPTPSNTPTPTRTGTNTLTPSNTPTPTRTGTPTRTPTPTITGTIRPPGLSIYLPIVAFNAHGTSDHAATPIPPP